MKSIVGPFAAAVALALAGAAFWIAGQTETRLADVHKQLAMLRYTDAVSEGVRFEQSLGLGRRVPMMGRAVEADARDARASAGYWQADYASIAPQHDANGVVTETDPAILLLSANAAFRASQNIDRITAVRRLDEVVRSYADVLKSQEKEGCAADAQSCRSRAIDAAFNYEFAIRTRDALAKNRPPAAAKAAKTVARAEDDDLPAGPTLHGHPGGPPPATDMNQFKIVIPKRGEERKDAPDAGKGGQKIRKG